MAQSLRKSTFIEAGGKKYRMEHLPSEVGLELQLLVIKRGFGTLLEPISNATEGTASSSPEDIASAMKANPEAQAQVLVHLRSLIQELSIQDLKDIKAILLPATYLVRDGEIPPEIRLDALPNHFESVADNARLLTLLAKGVWFQLSPLFEGLFTTQG